MRVIPTLFALTLATPALSIPVPRSLFARQFPGNSQSTGPTPAPTANGLVATQTTSSAPCDPTTERIINDLLTFANGDASVILNQIQPLAVDIQSLVNGMTKGAKISWMQSFNNPSPAPGSAMNPMAQNNNSPTPTTTCTDTSSATATSSSTTSTTSSSTTSSTASATATDSTSTTATDSGTTTSTDSSTPSATPTPSGDDDDDSGTNPPNVPTGDGGDPPDRRSLHSHSKRNGPACAQTYQSDPGDTCEVIGRKFGTSADAILSANPFLDCNDIWTATSICIPALTCAQTVTTQQGDTCQSLGTQYQASPVDIQNANVFLNCNNIAASTQVCIPRPASQTQGTGSFGGYGGYGGYNNYGYGANPQFGMQYGMMGAGMMGSGMNPSMPMNMPAIPVTPDNVNKLMAYVQRMQVLTTALERFAANCTNMTTTSTPPMPPMAMTMTMGTSTCTDSSSATSTTSATSSANTSTAMTTTTAAPTMASATPTGPNPAPAVALATPTGLTPSFKQNLGGSNMMAAPPSLKVHPWR